MSKIKTGTSLAAGFIGGVAFLVGCGGGSGSDPINNAMASAEELWQSFSNHIYYTDGNVGIGTNSPSSTLHVKGNDSDPDGRLIIESYQQSGTARDPRVEFHDAGGERTATIGSQTDGAGVPTRLQIMNYQNSSIEFWNKTVEVNSELMRISSSGNVGIGTTSPASKLAVSGLPTFAPDTSGNAGVVCVTNDGNFWLDNDGTADCN